MMEKAKSTRREEILEAAKQEFIKEGIAGARTKAIAQHIGVTKAMIHYYFDTKENLFTEVFSEASQTLMQGLMEILETEAPVFKKMEAFIDELLNRFHQHPELTGFVVNELAQHAAITQPIFQTTCEYDASIFRQQLSEAASHYTIAPVQANQLVANMIALCMFPYSARGFLRPLFSMDESQYNDAFLSNRRELIKDTIINGLAS